MNGIVIKIARRVAESKFDDGSDGEHNGWFQEVQEFQTEADANQKILKPEIGKLAEELKEKTKQISGNKCFDLPGKPMGLSGIQKRYTKHIRNENEDGTKKAAGKGPRNRPKKQQKSSRKVVEKVKFENEKFNYSKLEDAHHHNRNKGQGLDNVASQIPIVYHQVQGRYGNPRFPKFWKVPESQWVNNQSPNFRKFWRDAQNERRSRGWSQNDGNCHNQVQMSCLNEHRGDWTHYCWSQHYQSHALGVTWHIHRRIEDRR
ncbi:hypothetical protein F5050DRAFT_1716103 [Lentinula boryana]|uniref:Uncharacterized protein n=1 Tax=Lentinula boryana TaxID=40481 RepID=A0ABQ8PY96_9AGAR|nr:hypothetical protein F5050DRAFT_1716103 [Lentinula boryana]